MSRLSKKVKCVCKQCDALWDINNGMTLCEKCHRKQHKKKIKKGLIQLSAF
jgi:Zn finger protein HypA/HybF involved in hydrogenase expression